MKKIDLNMGVIHQVYSVYFGDDEDFFYDSAVGIEASNIYIALENSLDINFLIDCSISESTIFNNSEKSHGKN